MVSTHTCLKCRGSALSGGSSGGPWIANYGIDADLRGNATYGQDADRNVVMAVTGWAMKTPTSSCRVPASLAPTKSIPAPMAHVVAGTLLN